MNAGLERTTQTPQGIQEARRELLWWMRARGTAIRSKTPTIIRGSGLNFGYGGYVELVALDVAGAGPGQVTVRSEISSVNVGTERAQYLKLPNTSRAEGALPGGSLAGVITTVGRGSL